MRAVLYGALIVVVAVALTCGLLVLFLDNDHYRRLAEWLVAHESGAELHLSPDFQLDLGRHVRMRASQITFTRENDLDASVENVDLTIDVLSLRHKILLVEALEVGQGELRWQGSSQPRAARHGAPPILPVILRAHANDLGLTLDPAGGTEPLAIHLDTVAIDAPDAQSPTQVSASGTVNGRKLSVSGELGALATVWHPPADGFAVHLAIESPLASARVDGVLGNPLELSDARLEADCTVDSVHAALAAFADLPDLGSGHAKASLRGDLRQPAADDVQVQTSRPGLTLAAQGQAKDAWSIDGLVFKGFVHADLDRLPDSGFGAFSQVVANATFTGNPDGFDVTDLDGSATLPSGTQLAVAGQGKLGLGPSAGSTSASLTFTPQTDPSATDDPLSSVLRSTGALKLDATYSYAKAELDSDLESTGTGPVAVSATGRVSLQSADRQQASFQAKVTGLDKIEYHLAAELEQSAAGLTLESLTVTPVGTDARLTAKGTLRADQTNTIDLDLKANAGDVRPWLAAAGLTTLAEPIPVDSEARLAGTTSDISVPSLRVDIGTKDTVQVDIEGHLGHITPRPGPGVPIADVHLVAHVAADSTTRIADLFGRQFPHAGTVTADAEVSDRDGSLGLDSLHAEVSLPDAKVLDLSGRIGDVTNWRDIHWQGTASIPLATLLERWIPHDTDLGILKGSFLLTDEDGRVGLESFDLSSSAPRFNARLTGSFDDFTNLADLKVDTQINLSDTGTLDHLLGQGHGVAVPIALDGVLRGDTEALHYRGQFNVGRNEFDTKLSADFSRSPARWTASVVTAALYPAEIGLGTTPDNAHTEQTAERTTAKRLFSDAPLPLDWLKDKDMMLTVDIDSVVSDEYALQDLDLGFELSDGVLSVDPIKATFLGGGFQGHGRLADGDPPEASFTGVGKDVELGDLLALLTARRTVTGQVSLSTQLSSHGDSMQALASNLDGQIGVVLENGTYPNIYTDLLAADLFGLTMSRVTREHTARIDCGIGRFSVAAGVITTKAFFVDGPNLALTGTGTLDLGAESLDLTLLPKPKRSVFRAVAPVHVKGPMDDPHVTKISKRSVAQEVGALAFIPQFYLPVRALDYMYGLVAGDKNTPCLAPADRETLIQGLPTQSDVEASSPR